MKLSMKWLQLTAEFREEEVTWEEIKVSYVLKVTSSVAQPTGGRSGQLPSLLYPPPPPKDLEQPFRH